MEPDRQLFRKHWRKFLGRWLIPIPLAAVVLAARRYPAISRSVLPYLLAGVFLYVGASQVGPTALWRRREITYWQMHVLSAPIVVVAIICLLLFILIETVFPI